MVCSSSYVVSIKMPIENHHYSFLIWCWCLLGLLFIFLDLSLSLSPDCACESFFIFFKVDLAICNHWMDCKQFHCLLSQICIASHVRDSFTWEAYVTSWFHHCSNKVHIFPDDSGIWKCPADEVVKIIWSPLTWPNLFLFSYLL